MDDPYACIICWRRLSQPVVINCGHTFDRNCIDELKTCPICRANIISRSTNWQLISIIESKNRDTSMDSSSEEVELEEQYIQIINWTKLHRGLLIKYTINTKKAKIHYGWFCSFDSENQIARIQLQGGKTVQLPIEYINQAWYHPDLIKEVSEQPVLCCTII